MHAYISQRDVVKKFSISCQEIVKSFQKAVKKWEKNKKILKRVGEEEEEEEKEEDL
jgi:hypothetical protein